MSEIFHGEDLTSRRNRRRSMHELTRFYCGSKNSQATSTATSTAVTDSRKAVGDQGVLAEAGSFVDQSVNDNRDFTDNSVFSVDGSDRSTKIDNSQTFITTADPEIAKANAKAAETAFLAARDITETVATTSRDAAVAAFETSAGVTSKSLDTVSANNLKAFEFARGTSADALALASDVIDKAADYVAKDAAASRDFAGQFVGSVLAQAKSADERNVETITKAATGVAVAVALAYAVRGFGRNK